MKIKNKKLEWYVFREDFNSKKIVKYNVLNNFEEELYKEYKKKKITNVEELKEWLRREFFYRYGSKCEYEIIISGLFHVKESCMKINIYNQLIMNIDRIVEYIVRELEMFEHSSKRIKMVKGKEQ